MLIYLIPIVVIVHCVFDQDNPAVSNRCGISTGEVFQNTSTGFEFYYSCY